MLRFKIKFTLKQQTPIIHFQADQIGATLRATELKPKFDRFLLQQEEDLPKIKHTNNTFSLDYKVKIITISPHIEYIEKKNPRNNKEIPDPLFFGNLGDNKKKKFITSKEVQIEFKSFDTRVLQAIQQYFEAFLANTNFGTRQSKGYGSFYLQNSKFDPSLIPYKVYSFSSNDWKKDIKLFYQFLRQGINFPNKEGTRFYAKPAIFSYAKSKGWTWEKKVIKQKYFKQVLDQQGGDAVEYSSSQQYIVRDLFGLSSSQKWGKDYKNVSIEKEDKNKDEKGKPIIQRFKSPITFKVFDSKVYFWVNDTVEYILDQTFEIKAGHKTGLELKTPQRFDFDDFFKFTFDIDLRNHIEEKYHRENEYKTLVKIFKEIKENR